MSIEVIFLLVIGVFLISTLYIVFISMPTLKMSALVGKINRAFDGLDSGCAEDFEFFGVDWFGESRARTIRLLSKRPEALPKIKEIFSRIEKLLGVWNTTLANKEFMSDFDDTERIFKIAITNIEHICKGYVNGQYSYKTFVKELTAKANYLDDFIRNLSELADIRQHFGHAK